MILHFLYIDPGSGGYLIQIIIAGVLGIVFFFKNIGRLIKNFWLTLKSFFVKPGNKPVQPDQPGGKNDN